MQYLHKKNNDGSPLKVTAVKWADRISIHCFDKTKKTEIYTILKKFFQNDYLEIFFRSFYFTHAMPIAHKITLNRWEKKNRSSDHLSKININLFPVKEYLQDFLILNNIKFKNTTDVYTIKIIFFKMYHYIKNFIKKITFKISKKKLNMKNSDVKIAVAYNEGIDLDKRSDLFWLTNSKINPKDVILYFEYRGQLTRHVKKVDLLKNVRKLGIQVINLWEHDNIAEVDFLTELTTELKNLNLADTEKKSLKKISMELINKFKYWYIFFKRLNIKIHIDAKDFGQDIIVKYLALSKLEGCTLGRLRSHVEECLTGGPAPINPCDVFFIPNKDSAERLKNHTINKFQYMIINGYSYNPFTKNNITEIDEIKKFFKNNKKNFIVLLLDAQHSENKNNYLQYMSTDSLYNFYNVLFDKLSKIDDIGIIIKNKKISHLKNLRDMHAKVLDFQRKGFCYLVKEPFQKMPLLYASISNFVVAASSVYPSALMDCVLNKKMGVFCDLVNLKSVEKQWYKWGESKVIFKDASDVSKKIIEFKSGTSNSKYFGDWSDKKDLLDPYQDNLGSERVEKYLNFLLEGFNKKLSNSEAILAANNKFAENWGKDKIIECK